MGFRGKVKGCWRALLLCLALLPLCGCYMVHRHVAIVNVPDKGDVIQTKYRYCCIDKSNFDGWLQGGRSHDFYQSQVLEMVKKLYPRIFSDDGIPIVIGEEDAKGGYVYDRILLHLPLHLISAVSLASIVPDYGSHRSAANYSIGLATDSSEKTKRNVRVCSIDSEAKSFLFPWALLLYNGMPNRTDFCDFTGGKLMARHEVLVFPFTTISFIYDTGLRAMYYGIAMRLKEMEDAGLITERDVQLAAELHARHRRTIAGGKAPAGGYQPATQSARQTASASQPSIRPVYQPTPAYPQSVSQPEPVTPTANPSTPIQQQPVAQPAPAYPQSVSQPQPAYSLESLKWNERKDFECQFTIKMSGECSIEAFFEIQQKFEESLRNAYRRAHPSVKADSLVVDVRPSLDNGRISGRAAVLTITPEALSYDAVTRRGRLSVRFSPGQAEWAREWARRNIENLVRDKNILLTTGERPPPGHYTSLSEKWNGDILEIEFRTE